MELSYLIRYGLWPQVGRFAADSPDLGRGQTVVIRSHRGTELGEVLIRLDPASDPAPSPESATARVLRPASPDDLDRARQLDRERAGRFDLCRRIIQDRNEELELIDVEPLLDDRRIVLHYLGPHHLDTAELLAIIRSTCQVDVLFEPVGRDVPDAHDAPAQDQDHGHGCGHCGTGGGCGSGSGGGCSAGGGASHGGCSDCGIKHLLASRRPAAAR